MFSKSIESLSPDARTQRLTTNPSQTATLITSIPATPTAITPATINHWPTGDDGYSLQRFLAARPDEDANVIFARRAVRERFPGNTQAPINESTQEIPLQPYASATWMHANSVDVQPQHAQALETSRFQATGAGISPTHMRDLTAATHTPRLEPEIQSLGFSMRNFLATDPVDDANASYGKIALNENPGNYCPLTQILEDFEDVMGSDEKGCGIRRLLPYDKSDPQHKDAVTFWLDQLRFPVELLQ